MDITAPNKPPKVRRRRGFLLRFFGFMFAASMIVFVAVAAAAAFVLWKVSNDLPDYEVLAKYEPPVMTRIHANDGNMIAEFSRERRIYVPFTAIPDRLIHAFLSAEDKTFYQHGGIDIQGILRAVFTNFGSSGGHKVGASTITQQVAKNFLLSSDQTMERKLKEVILSIRIERAFTKKQILELYLNEIYLGGGAYGVAAAAQTYWNKSLNELSIADCAYLATLPKAPSNYNPFRFPERAVARRNWVIDRMVENGFVTKEDAEKAKTEPLGVQVRQTGARLAASEFFAEEVRRDIIDLFGEDKLYGGGLSVRTTLDPRLQKIARKTYVDGLVAYDHRHGWRGPVKKIELDGDWGKTLAAINVWGDIDPWRLAVVLEANKDTAKIGLRPTRTSAGKPSDERETGIIPFAEVKWARPKLKNGMGGSPRVMTDVLKPGDVIYVSPREPNENRAGRRRTMVSAAGPKDQWSARGHGSAYRARAGARRRLQLRRESIRPRGAGTPPAGFGLQAAHLYHCSGQRLHAGEHHRRRQALHQSRSGNAEMVPEELRGGLGGRSLDLARRHREVAQPDDGAPCQRHGHADHRRICEAVRRLRQSVADAVDGARRR